MNKNFKNWIKELSDQGKVQEKIRKDSIKLHKEKIKKQKEREKYLNTPTGILETRIHLLEIELKKVKDTANQCYNKFNWEND